jgi:hypothetical protein
MNSLKAEHLTVERWGYPSDLGILKLVELRIPSLSIFRPSPSILVTSTFRWLSFIVPVRRSQQDNDLARMDPHLLGFYSRRGRRFFMRCR